MRRTASGYCSAQAPVMPKVAWIPSRASVSRISSTYPLSAPASKVSATIFSVVSARAMVIGSAGWGGVGVGNGLGVGVGARVAVGDGVGSGVGLGCAALVGSAVAVAAGDTVGVGS